MGTAVGSSTGVDRCGCSVEVKPELVVVGSILEGIERVMSGRMREKSPLNQLPLCSKNWLEVTTETSLAYPLRVTLSSNSEMARQTSMVRTLPWVLQSLEL